MSRAASIRPGMRQPSNRHTFGAPKANVRITCRDEGGEQHTFEADGYVLRAVSGRFEKLLDGVDLAKHNTTVASGKTPDKVNEVDTPSTQSTVSLSTSTHSGGSNTPGSASPLPHAVILKEIPSRVLLLLQYINYASLLPFLPANRTFTARELLMLLDLAESYKFKDAPRATLRRAISRGAPALVMQATAVDDVRTLARLLESSRCPALARAFFRLDWDTDRVLLLHLHHLCLPWDMPEELIADLPADLFRALVFVEAERAMGSDMREMSVEYRGGQLAFGWNDGERVVFGEETTAGGRFFRR